MAKKTATKKLPPVKSGGFIKIVINDDGSYDISTKVLPTNQNLATYANVLADMLDNRFQAQLLTIFSESTDITNQQIAKFLLNFLKKYKTASKPLIPADKVFRPGKMK